MAVFAYFFVAVVAIASLADATDYCNLGTCRKGPHTMCLYPSDEVSSRCRSYEVVSLTPEERQEIVDAHNEFRAIVASGNAKSSYYGEQPAGVIGDLKWNDELELIAQRWANQCNYKHDACKNIDGMYVGQNLYQSSASNGYPGDLRAMVEGWYNEVEKFDPRGISRYQFDYTTGHYTQLVWGKTTDVGCGIMKYKDYSDGIEWFTTYLVCNYGPGGNMIGEQIYETL